MSEIHFGLTLWRRGRGVLDTRTAEVETSYILEFLDKNTYYSVARPMKFENGDQLMITDIYHESQSNNDFKYVHIEIMHLFME